MNNPLPRKSWRAVMMLAALIVSMPAVAATGRITDSATGKPIAGATVYAVWHEQRMFSDGRISCGGYTIVTTGANGEFAVGASFSFHDWWHNAWRDAQYWVVAPGYRGSDTLTSKDWSAKLDPLGNLPLDDKLRAFPSSGRIDNCLTSMQPSFGGVTQFARATRAVQFAAMCDPANGDTTPQTDVFLHMIPTTAQAPLLWRVFVNPLLPRQTSHPIPIVARNNACALASTSDEFDSAYRPPKVPLTLRISLKNVDDGLPAKKIPVRLLWDTRATGEHVLDAEHHDFLPRYAALTMADEEGNADFSIPPALLDENVLEHGRHGTKPRINYAAIPYADDRIGIDPALTIGNFDKFFTESELSPKLHATMQVSVPGYRSDDRLAAIAQREAQWHSGGLHYDPVLSTIHVYAWQWPATSLFWRAYDLITLPADVEADSKALVRLQRSELAQAFDALCDGDLQVRAPGPRSVLHALWWLDAQADGAVVANRNAQQRAQLWDDGARCGYRDGKLISVGSTQPPNLLTLDKVCSAWHAVHERLDGAPVTNALPVTQMQVDFSRRQDACLHLRDFGSSL